jgi:hypothetical protein
LEKESHDLLLLGARSARAARAGRTRRDVKRGRALPPVSGVHPRAALEETANGFRTSCANCAMQWSRARFVLPLDLCPCLDEEIDHRSLA